MNLTRLAFRNLTGSLFRSVAILLSAALVAGLSLTATLIIRGAEQNLRASLEKLGADLLVLPWGTLTTGLEGARLMSLNTTRWMPQAYTERVLAVEGVEAVAPQLYVTTLEDLSPGVSAAAPAAAVPDVYIVAYDPEIDFTVRPWIESGTVPAGPGEALAGHAVPLAIGETLEIYDTRLSVVGRLEPTGADLDQTLFVTFETANALAEGSERFGRRTLYNTDFTITAMLVKVGLDSDPREVALRIFEQVPAVLPIETPNLFQAERAQMIGLLRSILGLLVLIWVLALVFVGMIFSFAANERRRELAVLRALGATENRVLRMLLAEGALLALAGGLVGVLLAVAALSALQDPLTRLVGLPFSLPTAPGVVWPALSILALSLVSVTLAAYFPARRICRLEPALAMRE